MGSRIVTHELYPETSQAVERHIAGEEPPITYDKLLIHHQQEDHDKEVPQHFVEEGGMVGTDELSGGDPV